MKEPCDFFALEMLVREIVKGQNLIVSNSAIKAMLFFMSVAWRS